MTRILSSLLFFVSCSVLFSFSVSAQTESEGLKCGYDRLYNPLTPQGKAALEARAVAEASLQNWANRSAKTNETNELTVYTIPVVIHVIHTNGPEKISYEQAASQIEALNRDFRRRPGTLGYGNGADMGIEFTLATKDPQGNLTNGVEYIESELSNHNMDADEAKLKALSLWPPENYFNVWVVKSISDNVLGYARFPTPSNWGRDQDGIVVEYDSWGTVGELKGSNAFGRVTTHEVGHWLALPHTFADGWNVGCGNASCQTSGDNICDTPPVKESNFSATRINSCSNDTPDRPDDFRNYMDYTGDLYKDAFSRGQTNRSRAALTNPDFLQRVNLWTDANLKKTGTGKYALPVARFWANNQYPCPGSPVTFQSYAYNQPEEWFWEFPGATPAASNEANPTVVYSEPGEYNVILKVKNQTGESAPDTLFQFIKVSDAAAVLPFTEGFENEAFPPQGWKIDNQDAANPANKITFERFNKTGAYEASQNSVRLKHYSYNGYGQRDGLITPSLDLSNAQTARIDFDYAYVPLQDYTPNLYIYTDSLAIFASADCGANWTKIYQKGGEKMATGYDYNFMAIPKAIDWLPDSAQLKDFAGLSNVQLKFESINGFGNNFFIDNITVTPRSVNIIEEPTTVNASIFGDRQRPALAPNPFGAETELRFTLTEAAEVEVAAYLPDGRRVALRPAQWLENGEQRLLLAAAALPAGVYTFEIKANGQKYWLRGVKSH